ncbi:MAG: chitobiase/beta-hexosaminidase C-terminal domain-containing protein [Proteobacteria bacterium]|nr:chitobiase/beta-hexosaminidase C-terminal domain-containing protein [Pseudomonadota bacterium]
MSSLLENNGSGNRASANYQVVADVITSQPCENSVSFNYSVECRAVAPLPGGISCGIYINSDEAITAATSVDLGLVCSSPSGCSKVKVSNNGVGWSEPYDYATSMPWQLANNDGERQVFVKFMNGYGVWSGVCHDSIMLDTTAPLVTISPTGDTYMNGQSVALTASEQGAIYYTIDDSDPSDTSPQYTTPLAISADSTIKSFAVDVAGNAGPVASESYTICTGSNMSISGVVKDATLNNKGMGYVVVTLNSGHTATTTAAGNYSFTNLPRGNYRIESITTVTPGYMTYQKELELCKTSIANEDIILSRPDTVFGFSSNSGYGDGPVNTATGNYVYANADLQIPGRGVPFSFVRAYNSQDGTDGPFGIGWTHSYNVHLAVSADNEVTVRLGDGKAETWTPDGSGGYTPRYGVFSSLTKNGDNTYTIRQKDMTEYNFNGDNRIASIVDAHGNRILFNYEGGILTSITDTVDRTISISYDTFGHITRLLDPLGRSVNYVYDGSGDLVNVLDLGGNSTAYTYDTNHQILTITDPLNHIAVSNTYDEQKRVVSSQRDAIGAETLYSYDGVNKSTTVTDPYGNTSYHYYNEYLQLVREVDALGHEATYAYDDRGNLVSAVDKRGNETTYAYDANGNVLTKTEPLGRVTSALYDANNNPTSKADAKGNTTLYTYDPTNGNLLSEEDALHVVTAYTYDQYGQVLTETYAVGTTLETVTSFEYDQASGDLVAVQDVQGNRSTSTYDAVGRKLTENHPLGRSKAYDYDAMDRLLSITDALGKTTSFTYDANGNKVQHVDAKGNISSFAYDAKNRLISRTSAEGRTESYQYDKMDRRVALTDPMGRTTQTIYDALGNVIQRIDPVGNSARHEYDANGNRVKTVDAKGNVTTFVYDALNRLVSITEPLGVTESYAYDVNGNRLTVTDAQSHLTTYTFDARDRLKTVADHLGNSVTNEYDELGRFIRVTDAKNKQTNFSYDSLGRLVQVVDAEGGVVAATYDALGNRLTLTDTRSNTTEYSYDDLNRLLSESDPLGNSVSMEYDVLGNLAALTEADNRTTTYSYDKDNRLVSMIYPGAASTATYSYDANGNRLSVVDGMGTTIYSYDELNQVAAVTDPFGQTVGYTYDPNGNRSSTRYPGNRSVYYYFDAQDRLTRVEDWGGIATSYQYDTLGRLSGMTMGNEATVAYSYDDANRLIAKTDLDAHGSLVAGYILTIDSNGNRTGLEMEQPLLPMIADSNDSFIHNEANQLSTSNGKTYNHDVMGNRTRQDDGVKAINYSYNDDGLLDRVVDGATVYEYHYNSAGHRLSSVMNSTETRYLLDTNGGMEYVLAEMDGSNNAYRYYVYGDGLLYSIDAATGTRHYYHYDPIGSTVAITDKDGIEVNQYAYLPYGKPAAVVDSADSNPFRYIGKFGVMQEPTGMQFMRARFYDPDTRRFMSKDPVKGDMKDSQTLNQYSYAKGNPITYIDPDGEFAWVVFVPIVTGIVGGISTTTKYLKNNEDATFGGAAKAFALGGVGGVAAGIGAMLGPVGGLVGGLTAVAFEKSAERSLRAPTGDEVLGDVPDFIAGGVIGAASGSLLKIRGRLPTHLKTMFYGKHATHLFSSLVGELASKAIITGLTSGSDAEKTVEILVEEMMSGSVSTAAEVKTPSEIAVVSMMSEKKERSWAEIRELTRQRREEQRFVAEQRRLESKLRKRARAEAKKDRQEERERMRREKDRLERELYAQLTSLYSKHHVLIQELSSRPAFNSGNRNRVGAYGN